MQTKIEIQHTQHSQNMQQFVHPEALLQNLLLSLSSPCNCSQSNEESEAIELELND